ncbi:MAG TPA: hypothetical protein VLT33_49905 [Labilithrix sp.]|nr:hypothetical protein [Labilithrix sp.]
MAAVLRATTSLLLVGLLSALGACTGPAEIPSDGLRKSSAMVEALPRAPSCDRADAVGGGARGMWVWATGKRLADPNAASTLLETARALGLTELYLSVGGEVLDDARLPPLVSALARAGLRVEALMGEATWYRADQRPAMLARIDDVGAYNAQHAPGFAAVHLDVEPHQLPENRGDHGFLDELATSLAEASARASQRCMSTSADLPRFALEDAGPAFARAVQRPFVMLYQLRSDTPAELAAASAEALVHTYAGLTPEQRGRLVVSLRVEDYTTALPAMVSSLDDAYGDTARYGGWAIHDEAKYRALARP